MDLELIKSVGIVAARKGADVLLSHFGKISKIDKKSNTIDLVTEADTASEKIILDTILKAFPAHAALAEESGMNAGKTDEMWIIDPLDGTTNFAHRLGLFSISIAFAVKGEIVTGIVLVPVTGELFMAVKGRGATLNSRQVEVTGTRSVSESLLATGFPYDRGNLYRQLMERFSRCTKASQGVRRLGSAAIDLCYVACGRFDAFWEQNLNPWDTAAGMLIAKEAGATVTDFSNRPFTIDKKEILATNGNIHNEMLSLLELKDASQ